MRIERARGQRDQKAERERSREPRGKMGVCGDGRIVLQEQVERPTAEGGRRYTEKRPPSRVAVDDSLKKNYQMRTRSSGFT